jgi:6-phosphogluconolactonase
MTLISKRFRLAMIITMATMTSPLAKSASAEPDHTKYFLYVGTYGKGIYAYHFDAHSGNLQSIGLAGEIVNPSWITTDPHHRYLYAVSEIEGKVNGGVAAFALDRRSGMLRKLNSMSSAGVAPCHLSVDRTGRMLLVANYGTGGVGVFAVGADGSLRTMTGLLQAEGHSVNPKRQQGPHAHEAVITADNRFAYVPDLGLDRIRIYRLDPSHASATENSPAFVSEQPGYGPRHIAFAPGDRHAYVVNELKSFVTVYTRDSQNGNLHLVQQISTLPEGFTGENAPAEIAVDHAGRFVYATNRGANTVAVFAIDPATGTLRMVQSVSSEGDFPRGFSLDPTGHYAFVGNQKSDDFAVFEVDQATGHLRFTGERFKLSAPVGFAFVPED